MKIDIDPGTLDIEEPVAQALSFGLHPNPATDLANVQIENGFGAQITLFSPTGELIERVVARSQVTDWTLGIFQLEFTWLKS